jgi:hypothetical protein
MATRKVLFGLLFASFFVGLFGNEGLAAEDSLGMRKAKATQRFYEAAYRKLKDASDSDLGKISVEELQRASIKCLQVKLFAARVESDYVTAASEYLEREGFLVSKKEK